MNCIHQFRVSFVPTLLLLSSITYSPLSIAAPERSFPHGCQTQGVIAKDGLIVFTPKIEGNRAQQSLYFIHNISQQGIRFKAEKSPNQPFAPPYENAIQANQWGAFATDLKEIAFICSAGSAAMPEKVNCADVLEVCQYDNVKFSSSNGGNYWVVKSDSMQGAMRGAIHIGILLRW